KRFNQITEIEFLTRPGKWHSIRCQGGTRGMLRLPSLCPGSPLSFARELTILIAITAALFSGTAYAQLSSASVTGVVRDPSGSVVAGVKLALTNLDTTVKHTAESNSAGNYVFLSIPPGNYTLEAT